MLDTPDPADLPARIAILGGTGKLGGGLARRWAAAGVQVTIGSRDGERAENRAFELAEGLPPGAAELTGGTNVAAADAAAAVVVAVPYDGAAALVTGLAGSLAGKLVVSAVNPLGFDAAGPHPLAVEGFGSAAEQLAAAAPDGRWTAALHSVSSVTLTDLDAPLDDDVLVAGDDESALSEARTVVAALGVRPVVVGPLRLAGTLEALTAVLIAVNKRHRTHAGVRLTGL